MSVSYYIRETRGWGSPDRWTTESEEELQRLVRSKTAYDLNPDRSRARFWNDLWTLGEASTGGSLPIIAYAERPAEMSNLKRNPSMSSRIRQHKSPYFYVRKGSGFVLLDNHEETSTRYKTEAEAKKAVLALNDAWRAKHAPRANPGPMMYSIMRAQEEARKKAKRNPEGDVSLTLWARPKGQTDALYEQPIYTVGRTMDDIERVKKLAAKDGWHTFRVQRIDLSKPYNPQQEFAATVRGSRRRNPRKHVQSDAQAQVLHLFATATVGAGRELDAFATRLGRGEALSALDIEDAAIAAEARLEDAEYELKTNRIAEYRAGLREERDEFRQLLAAIKALKPSHTRNPRKYDESRDDAGFRKVSDLKKGEYFKRKPDARKVYRKGDYDRAERKYECGDTDDISRAIYLKGDALVYVGFDY